MKKQLRALLLASSGVTAFVPGSRINWGERPQGAGLPALMLNRVSGSQGMTMQGSDGLESSRVQIDAYALDYADAEAIALAVVDVLRGHRDGNFSLITHDDTNDRGREGGTNEAERPFRFLMQFTTHWSTP